MCLGDVFGEKMENKHVFVMFVENYNDRFLFIYFLLKEKYNKNRRNKLCLQKSSCSLSFLDRTQKNLLHSYNNRSIFKFASYILFIIVH